jgi:hypothetical protein
MLILGTCLLILVLMSRQYAVRYGSPTWLWAALLAVSLPVVIAASQFLAIPVGKHIAGIVLSSIQHYDYHQRDPYILETGRSDFIPALFLSIVYVVETTAALNRCIDVILCRLGQNPVETPSGRVYA